MNALVDRRYELEFMEVVDITEYALQWAMLAADFRAAGMFTNAALCDNKADYYLPQEEQMPITEETYQTVLVYDSGMVVHALPPITIYSHGEVITLDVLNRTELSDELVVLDAEEQNRYQLRNEALT